MDNLIKCQCKSQQAINPEYVHKSAVTVRMTEQLPQQGQQGGQAQHEPGSGFSLWCLRMVLMESHTEPQQGMRLWGKQWGRTASVTRDPSLSGDIPKPQKSKIPVPPAPSDPALLRGWTGGSLEVPSNPNHPRILGFWVACPC